MTTLKFHYNGIRAPDSKLQRCTYAGGHWINLPARTITIRAKTYMHFSEAVRAVFDVQDDGDPYSDYCSNEYIRVTPDHPLYAEVLAAYEQAKSKEGSNGQM